MHDLEILCDHSDFSPDHLSTPGAPQYQNYLPFLWLWRWTQRSLVLPVLLQWNENFVTSTTFFVDKQSQIFQKIVKGLFYTLKKTWSQSWKKTICYFILRLAVIVHQHDNIVALHLSSAGRLSHSFHTEGVSLQHQTIQYFPSFHTLSFFVWDEVCVCGCVHILVHACTSEQFDFLFVCLWSGREGMCLFSLSSLLCSAPARSERSENKRGKGGGESAPTVDLAIVGGGRNTIPIEAVDTWLKPPEALGRELIQGLMWPAGLGWKMGVEPIVGRVGTLSCSTALIRLQFSEGSQIVPAWWLVKSLCMIEVSWKTPHVTNRSSSHQRSHFKYVVVIIGVW